MKSIQAAALCVVVVSLIGCNKQKAETPSQISATPSAKAPAPVAPSPAPAIRTKKTYDGPFGLAMGISTTELVNEFQFKNSIESNPELYLGQPPKPVSGMNEYMITATSQQGLCRIIALQDVNVVNDSGDQLKAETDKIAEMVALKYGKHTKKYDFATQDVYRRNPQFWMMALREDAVTYAYGWENGKAGLNLPNDIASIEVSAGASQMSKGWVRVAYQFTNYEACKTEMKKKKATNF